MNGEYEKMIKKHGNLAKLLEDEKLRKNVEFIRAAFDVCKHVVISDDGYMEEQNACHNKYGVVPSLLFIDYDGYCLGCISAFESVMRRMDGRDRQWRWVCVAVSGSFLVMLYSEYLDRLTPAE